MKRPQAKTLPSSAQLPEVDWSEKRTGPSRRTSAEREAINARAKAWKRPKRRTKR